MRTIKFINNFGTKYKLGDIDEVKKDRAEWFISRNYAVGLTDDELQKILGGDQTTQVSPAPQQSGKGKGKK